MGRVKRGYKRVIPEGELKRDYRLFAIACEGSKREREYFEMFEGISSRVIVEYIKDEEYPNDPPSAPNHVLRRAQEYVAANDLNEEDSIWLVMDVDKWGPGLNEANEYCKQHDNWHIVISNPCFEIWLLFHTRNNLDGIDISSSQRCKTALNEETPAGYSPKKYIVLLKEAMNNAREADTSNGWYPKPGNTKMHELVSALMNSISQREFETFIARMNG